MDKFNEETVTPRSVEAAVLVISCNSSNYNELFIEGAVKQFRQFKIEKERIILIADTLYATVRMAQFGGTYDGALAASKQKGRPLKKLCSKFAPESGYANFYMG
jgi:hypothetical protein